MVIDIYKERKKLGLTQAQLGKKLGVSYQTIQNWEGGSKIPPARLGLVLSFLDSIKNTDLQVLKKSFSREVKEVEFDEFMEAEYLPIKVQAGYLQGIEEKQPIELKKMLVPKEFEKGYYKVIEIEGDSMNDGTPRSICDGDKLLLKEADGGDYLNKVLPYRNSLFVIVSKEGIVCKQIILQDIDKEIIVCHSFNPLHKDYEISFEDIYQIFYVKKLVERKIKF